MSRARSRAVAERAGDFAIDPDTGYVSVAAPLDRETVPACVLEVRARDRGVPALSSTLMNVEIADVGDNLPEFELRLCHAAVPELAAPGAELLRARATSRDAGGSADVCYVIVGSDGREDFALDRASGVLTVARPLDYERGREYALAIQATDDGSPPLSGPATPAANPAGDDGEARPRDAWAL